MMSGRADVRYERLVLGDLSTNCWIVGADDEGPCVVIDPADDVGEILSRLAGRSVVEIVLTHAHFDHIGALESLRQATAAPVSIHAEDAGRLVSSAAEGTGAALFGYTTRATAAERVLHHGDKVILGDVELEVLHTPGHTRGSICLLVGRHLFSGDTLFSGSVGRTDFPGGSGSDLARTIAEKLAPLPPETVVHPGHGPDTTIASEQRRNPFWPRA